MGHVFDFKEALAYERWIEKHRGRFEGSLENLQVLDMLKPAAGESILDIGCGNGVSLVSFLEAGLRTAGLDASPYMLDLAYDKVGHRADLYRGVAENLPFEDNSFNHACFVTTLEFVEDAEKALAEACRVAKDRVFIGLLNRQAIRGIRLRLEGMSSSASLYRHARFFSIWELQRMARFLMGDVPITWRTVCQPPPGNRAIAAKIEQSCLLHKNPFGAFGGLVITLVPRFKARPLAISYRPKQTPGAVAG